MTALDLNRSPTPDSVPAIICVDTRTATAAEVQLSLRNSMAHAQLAWVGFRHSGVIDPMTEIAAPIAQKPAPSTWIGFAEGLFPGSRKLTSDEAKEIDAAILKNATPLGRRRQY